jgi:hypothetical protein
MKNTLRRRIIIAILCVSFMVAVGPPSASAQSGSAGGSIGNDEKSLSGSRSAGPERPARPSKPEAEEPRRSTSRRGSGGGGAGSFDGAWIVNSVGITCSGSSTTAVVVTSGRIIGEGLTGTVSPSGAASSVGHYDGGLTVVSTGHVSGRGGSGTFKRSDGCIGKWSSSKQ